MLQPVGYDLILAHSYFPFGLHRIICRIHFPLLFKLVVSVLKLKRISINMQICQPWAYNSNWLELNSCCDVEMSYLGFSFLVSMLLLPSHLFIYLSGLPELLNLWSWSIDSMVDNEDPCLFPCRIRTHWPLQNSFTTSTNFYLSFSKYPENCHSYREHVI